MNSSAKANGGAVSITAQSAITVIGSLFAYNKAEKGAALAADMSCVSFDSSYTEIYKNSAKSGGGIYLESSSTVHLKAQTDIKLNQAQEHGGGIHAVNSNIGVQNTINFERNRAAKGGAISLIQSKLFDLADEDDVTSDVSFTSNEANYGGAISVQENITLTCSSDITRIGTRNNTIPIGCFFQYATDQLDIRFYKNNASISGHDLYGGLLDTCSFWNYTSKSLYWSTGSAKARFKEISNISNFDTVSSEPVRVCYCQQEKLNCENNPPPIHTKRGDSFSVSIAAVDQVGKMVGTIVFSSLSKNLLPKDQTITNIGAECSKLDYNVPFPDKTEDYNLTVYANGTCLTHGISVDIHVSECSCAPGFMREDTKYCFCVCDKDETFSKYITHCYSKTESVTRKGRFWIMYLNNSDNPNYSPYFIHRYCPLDYCKPPSKPVNVTLNLPNGSDAQCAGNRGGLLCGQCLLNYSLSLGSSKCIKCPDNWYGQLVGFVIASIFLGIILVFLILVLNVTVAVGTLNSIIFYANIIYASNSTYFGQTYNSGFVSIFVSSLNLGFALDVCFFEGMDTFTKTWVQIAFPLYVILLVFLVILTSSYSSRFSNLIGRKDPVATLATLILLSYSRLIQTVIMTFSYVTLEFPNGTTSTKWLPDANIQFLKGKHILLFCVAVLILFFDLLYTVLILSKQWLVRCPQSKLFKSIRLNKLHSFIDTYHVPNTAKHRYWTGFLLLIRVIVYLISAFSVSHDPRITLLSTVIIMCLLLLYKSCLKVRLYRNKLLNAMESFTYFNIATFAVVTWYTSESVNGEILRNTFTNISVYTMFALFLMVTSYHTYRYSNAKLYFKAQNSEVVMKIKEWFFNDKNQDYQSPLDSHNYTLFGAIDNERESGGYTPPSLQLHEEPTSSVVSITSCNKSSLECLKTKVMLKLIVVN